MRYASNLIQDQKDALAVSETELKANVVSNSELLLSVRR